MPQSDRDPAFADPARQARWRRGLMHKGMEVNGQLTKLLASKNATLATMKLPNEEKPGEKPEERLRRFLNQIIAAQHRVGTTEFGKCQECGVPLPPQAFDDAPWLQECAPCFGRLNDKSLPF